MWRLFPALASLTLTLTVPLVAAEPADPRIKRLQKQLMAPCCYTQNLADHRSEAALAMNKEIESLVQSGMSDRAILDLFKQRYGARILVEPEGPAGSALTIVPVVITAVGLAALVLILHRMRARTPLASANGAPLPDLPEDGS